MSVFNNLCSGTYSVEVMDFNVCISIYPDFVIVDPPALGISNYYVSSLSCNGLSNGFIEVIIEGGGSQYFTSWSNGITATSLTSLSAGEYCLTIINLNGCIYDTCFNMLEPDALDVTYVKSDVECQGVNEGTITVDISGGTTPYNTTWTKDGFYYSLDEDLINLGAGIYCLTITDFNGCQYSFCDTIIEPLPLTLMSGQVEEISCYNGICDGVIEIGVSGGTPGIENGEIWNYYYRLFNGNSMQYTSWQTVSIFNNLCSGSYSVEVKDFNNCISAYPFFEVGEPDSFNISSIIEGITCETCSDGFIDLSVQGGFAPYYFSWSNGEVTEDINQLLAGEYTLTINDINLCFDTVEFIVPSYPDPGWPIINTGIKHTIFFDDTTAAFLDCSPLITGDFIGVFYDSSGVLSCAGYLMWTGDSILMDVYGDDPLIAGKSGFYENEVFQWKAWRASDSTLHDLLVNYITTDPAFPDENLFVIDGASWVENVFSIVPQILYLPQGWSMFSINTTPTYPNVSDMFFPISNSVVILKNGNGLMYWPTFSLNNIGNIEIGEGYQVNMFNADTLVIEGICLRPELTPIEVAGGWSMIGYLRKTPADVIEMITPIQNNLLLLKNDMGAAYWPYFGLNLIGDMIPGKGYQIKMILQDTLTYPANDTISIFNNTIMGN